MMKNITCLLFMLLLISCSKKHDENFSDLQGIQVGMKFQEVLDHMIHEPLDQETAYWNDELFVLSFSSPAAASDYYKIIFEKKDSTVVKINFGN